MRVNDEAKPRQDTTRATLLEVGSGKQWWRVSVRMSRQKKLVGVDPFSCFRKDKSFVKL